MNFFLLLSALLSALTGVGSGVGRVQATPAVAERTIGEAIAKIAVGPMPARPVQALPPLRANLVMLPTGRSTLPPIPLWANRRRE